MTTGHDMPLRLAFPGLSRPVHLLRAGDLVGPIQATLNAWAPVLGAGQAGDRPFCTLVADRRRYALRSDYLDAPLTGLPAASALCGLIADLSEMWAEDRPDHIVLHAGGVEVGGGCIAFLGQARAGKSTLMARLTAEPDMTVLCDDVLPVTPEGRAVGLGTPPRLRRPLPPGASAAFRTHVAARSGISDDLYAYLSADTVAPHGTTVPLRAVVILSRRPAGPARLHAAPVSEATAALLGQCMCDPAVTPDLSDRIAALAVDLPAYRLVYSDLEDAVALIRKAFAAGVPQPSDIGPPLPSDLAEPPAPPVTDHGAAWLRSPTAGLRRRGDAAVLWDPAVAGQFHLNPVAAAVWSLLDEPTSVADAADLLAEVFSDIDRARIAADVAALMGELSASGLIRRAEPGGGDAGTVLTGTAGAPTLTA